MDYSRDRMVLNVAKWEVLSPTEIFTPKTRTHRPVRAALPIDAEAIAGTYGRADILPIEFFKWHAEAMKGFLPGPLARSFLSSGTTRSEQSQSSFTQEGLELYRKFSIQAFKSVLSHFFAHVPNTQGFSLIPPVHEWPTSSLAQMVEWISEEMPVHSLSTTEGFQPSEPIWLFATAFHLVNLADQGFQIQLPPGSIVIETGGTKGRSRTVSREELYTLIQKTLGVQRNRVVSEYGMCELASQAYDFVDFPDGPELNLSDRWYRLPVWADAYIFDRLSQLESSGEGALIIYDNLRTDFPWPIRSEDMVSLREDGAFQLLGRVPFAPLKGCSMLAEQVLEQTKFIERPLPSVNFPQNHLPKPGITARAEILHRQVQSIVDDPLWYDYWLSEFNSIQVVEWLRQDLRHTLPKDIHAWCLAAQQAIDPSSPRRWLIVPPSSHSFAWLQPLLIGAVAGLELVLRADPDHALVKLIKTLLSPIASLDIWPNSFKIGRDPLPDVDALMVYGSDETISEIRRVTRLPLQAFGNYITASIADYQEISNTAQAILKDAFSLMQRGCMASRLVFILNTPKDFWDFDGLVSRLLETSPLPVGTLSLGLDLSLEHSSLLSRRCGRNLRKRRQAGEPLLRMENFDPQLNLAELLEPAALSLCLIAIPTHQLGDFTTWLQNQKDIKQLAIGSRERAILSLDPRFKLVPPGQSNANAWNGFHEARPLFGGINRDRWPQRGV